MEAETLALLTCAECRPERERGETWSLRFADPGEVYGFCPECDEREFGCD